MGNLCSIFHLRFKSLVKVIPSARKAQLVDYILLGWQTSTYTLKNSDHTWFMKPYTEIVEDTGIPKSTLERYIKELVEEGFIERRQALYSRTKEQGGFEVKKGNYIHITDKLLALINPSKPVPETPTAAATDIHNDPSDSCPEGNQEQDNKELECKEVDINEGIDPLKMRGLYISDLYNFFINNINLKKLTRSVDKTTLLRLTQQFKSIETLLTSEIKEEIPDEIKRRILGAFFNLTFKQKKQISSPKQLVSEYLFALLNTEFYLPNVSCFKHRNNILSKIIQENRWRTPKGFYKHFYLGETFKDRTSKRDKAWQDHKNYEIRGKYSIEIAQDNRLNLIDMEIYEKGNYIERLKESIARVSSEEEVLEIREKIEASKRELEYLWEQQALIERKIKQEQFDPQGCCA